MIFSKRVAAFLVFALSVATFCGASEPKPNLHWGALEAFRALEEGNADRANALADRYQRSSPIALLLKHELVRAYPRFTMTQAPVTYDKEVFDLSEPQPWLDLIKGSIATCQLLEKQKHTRNNSQNKKQSKKPNPAKSEWPQIYLDVRRALETLKILTLLPGESTPTSSNIAEASRTLQSVIEQNLFFPLIFLDESKVKIYLNKILHSEDIQHLFKILQSLETEFPAAKTRQTSLTTAFANLAQVREMKSRLSSVMALYSQPTSSPNIDDVQRKIRLSILLSLCGEEKAFNIMRYNTTYVRPHAALLTHGDYPPLSSDEKDMEKLFTFAYYHRIFINHPKDQSNMAELTREFLQSASLCSPQIAARYFLRELCPAETASHTHIDKLAPNINFLHRVLAPSFQLSPSDAAGVFGRVILNPNFDIKLPGAFKLIALTLEQIKLCEDSISLTTLKDTRLMSRLNEFSDALNALTSEDRMRALQSISHLTFMACDLKFGKSSRALSTQHMEALFDLTIKYFMACGAQSGLPFFTSNFMSLFDLWMGMLPSKAYAQKILSITDTINFETMRKTDELADATEAVCKARTSALNQLDRTHEVPALLEKHAKHSPHLYYDLMQHYLGVENDEINVWEQVVGALNAARKASMKPRNLADVQSLMAIAIYTPIQYISHLERTAILDELLPTVDHVLKINAAPRVSEASSSNSTPVLQDVDVRGLDQYYRSSLAEMRMALAMVNPDYLPDLKVCEELYEIAIESDRECYLDKMLWLLWDPRLGSDVKRASETLAEYKKLAPDQSDDEGRWNLEKYTVISLDAARKDYQDLAQKSEDLLKLSDMDDIVLGVVLQHLLKPHLSMEDLLHWHKAMQKQKKDIVDLFNLRTLAFVISELTDLSDEEIIAFTDKIQPLAHALASQKPRYEEALRLLEILKPVQFDSGDLVASYDDEIKVDALTSSSSSSSTIPSTGSTSGPNKSDKVKTTTRFDGDLDALNKKTLKKRDFTRVLNALFKKHGGSFNHRTGSSASRVEVGDEVISMHIPHGRRRGANDFKGGRLKSLRQLAEQDEELGQ